MSSGVGKKRRNIMASSIVVKKRELRKLRIYINTLQYTSIFLRFSIYSDVYDKNHKFSPQIDKFFLKKVAGGTILNQNDS